MLPVILGISPDDLIYKIFREIMEDSYMRGSETKGGSLTFSIIRVSILFSVLDSLFVSLSLCFCRLRQSSLTPVSVLRLLSPVALSPVLSDS